MMWKQTCYGKKVQREIVKEYNNCRKNPKSQAILY